MRVAKQKNTRGMKLKFLIKNCEEPGKTPSELTDAEYKYYRMNANCSLVN